MKKFFVLLLLLFLFISATSNAQDSIQINTESIEVQDSRLNQDSTDSNTVNPSPSSTTIRETTVPEDLSQKGMIKSQGVTFQSVWRGLLGIIALVFISFLFSSNKKAINWKVVGIGLAFQLLIAIGVLKIEFIKMIFEFIGGLFVEILEFTKAGSKFLFEGLVVDMDTFGFIFAFQVLPTIIFFSALTSVLFYLGIIQKVVKAMAWLLSKALKISFPGGKHF